MLELFILLPICILLILFYANAFDGACDDILYEHAREKQRQRWEQMKIDRHPRFVADEKIQKLPKVDQDDPIWKSLTPEQQELYSSWT